MKSDRMPSRGVNMFKDMHFYSAYRVANQIAKKSHINIASKDCHQFLVKRCLAQRFSDASFLNGLIEIVYCGKTFRIRFTHKYNVPSVESLSIINPIDTALEIDPEFKPYYMDADKLVKETIVKHGIEYARPTKNFSMLKLSGGRCIRIEWKPIKSRDFKWTSKGRVIIPALSA